jgi:hypothetical protein
MMLTTVGDMRALRATSAPQSGMEANHGKLLAVQFPQRIQDVPRILFAAVVKPVP